MVESEEERVFEKVPPEAMRRHVDAALKATKGIRVLWKSLFARNKWGNFDDNIWEGIKKLRNFKTEDKRNTILIEAGTSLHKAHGHLTVSPEGQGSKVFLRWSGWGGAEIIVGALWTKLESLVKAAPPPARKAPAPEKPAEVKKEAPAPKLEPSQIHSMVYGYIVSHKGEIDVEECAKELEISEDDIVAAIKALKAKGKIQEM